ncbi:hypothetical protein NW249_17630 [Streptomyces sp. OUCMDZ-4982]|uniref:hypothetical protein n=1 Tax=Streptomyces sp. OUCMDZ-4982 TaxID=2973090 RepID=UPI00215BB8C4|nr:hypothetical protein [Streptomyces sp. OUCMDZ-4982]MCR8943948.1 hypothetical protein [Streptomyces sp. OUCMDZ-4982]
MADIDIPPHLVELERAAYAEQQAGALTVATAAAVQQAITKHAAATNGLSRYELERAVKAAVRHPA